MKNTSVRSFVEFLESQPRSHLQNDEADRVFKALCFEPHAFDAYTYFCDDHYARNLVARGLFFELIVVAWLPDQETSIHDHGGQRCWTWVQTGELRSLVYRCEEGKAALSQGEEVLRSGGPSYIDDKVGWHALTNPGNKPAVSVHLYADPIDQCRTFCNKTFKIHSTQADYFTEYGQPILDLPGEEDFHH